MTPDYAAILSDLYPGAEWSLSGNDPATLQWFSDGDAPTAATLDAAWPAVRDARAWAQVRAERDRLLTDCDWTQVADAPVDAAAWADYRQQLRDLPQNYILPDDVEWPEEPA